MIENVDTAPEPVVLIIADISGYTNYMTANAKTLSHSQTIITELVKTILKEVNLPLRVAKLEGDAVFLFARKEADPQAWSQNKKLLGQKLIGFFEAFSSRLTELFSSTTCSCNACTNIQQLKLKVVVHSGEALFHRVLEFEELAGVDVIIVHRLLKNSVEGNQYLLLTAAAQQDIELPGEIRLVNGREKYDGIGEINVGIHYLDKGSAPLPEKIKKPGPSRFADRLGNAFALFLKLWFSPLAKSRGHLGNFQHINSSADKSGRIGFAALTVLLTPIYLPIGTLFVLAHSLRRRDYQSPHAGHEHVHKPDESCCAPVQGKH